MHHLITGGSGFFGLHLIDALLAKGETVTVYDLAELDPGVIARGVRYIKGDVRDPEALRAAFRGVDVVHHNAAVLPIARAGKTYWDVNVQGTRNVLQAALESGVKKVLNVSTSSVYGIPQALPITEETPLTPLGQYGFAKEDGEKAAKEFRTAHDLDVSIVRPRTIIGTGRLGIFGILFDWVRRGKRVYIIGKGDNLFQLVSAPDLADACVRIATMPCRNEDFNIGADVYGTVRGDLEKLIAHAGTGARVQSTPGPLVRGILTVVDKLKISPLVDWHYKTPHKPFYFDCTKAKTMLGWQPKDSNEKALCDTYDWYIAHRDEADRTGTTHRKSVKQGVLKLLRAVS